MGFKKSNLTVTSRQEKSQEAIKQIWKFIYDYIDNNSANLFKIKQSYANDQDFFKYLSDSLMEKLSTEMNNTLKSIHKNTVKALPNNIIAIFLLSLQKIKPITGVALEKKSRMVGQYRKLREIADQLGFELPFIMGDVVEKILEENKDDIFSGKFFPHPKALIKIDRKLKPSRRMTKTISRWIQKNSDYKNLTELKQVVFEKLERKPKKYFGRYVLLDEDKFQHSSKIRKIIDEIIQREPNISSYADVKRIIGVDVTPYFRTEYRRFIKLPDFLKIQEIYGKPIPHKKFVRRFRDDNNKWIFLWQDSEGNPLNKKEFVKAAANYLLKKILKFGTSNYSMEYVNDALGRSDFISILVERGIKYNEVLEAIDLEILSEPGKWENLIWSEDGQPRTYEDALINAAEEMKRRLVDYDYDVFNIPTRAYIKNYHEDFLGGLRRSNLNFSDVLKKAGFPDDFDRKKWWFFDYDEQGNPLTPQEQKDFIYQFFVENILSIYTKKNQIENKLGPNYDEAINALGDTDFHGFVSAANARGFAHGDLLLSVGISPRVTPNQEAGVAFHWIAENIFMKHTRIDNNCLSFYESKLIEESSIRPDNSVLVNEELRRLSSHTRQIAPNIKKIHIDYYLFHARKRSHIHKSGKGYQSSDSILIMVPLNLKESRTIPVKNVKLLSVYDFCDFFGFSDNRRKEFVYYARLALGAIKDSDKMNELKQKANMCKEELETNPKINFKI